MDTKTTEHQTDMDFDLNIDDGDCLKTEKDICKILDGTIVLKIGMR